MLESIRKGQRWLTAILVALIGGVFVFFMGLGGPLQGGPSQGMVVELGDIRLAVADFQRVRAQQADAYRRQLGDDFNNQLAANFLDSQALRALVDRAILAHEAEALGLRVGKKEIQRVIRDSRGFRDENGRFDNGRFSDFVQYEYGSQRNYLDYMRRALMGQKMAQLLYTQGEVSEGEARVSVLYRLQQVRIAYVALDTEDTLELEDPTPEQLAEFAASNEAQLRTAYDEKQADYTTRAQVRLRHILFELGAEPSEEDIAEAELAAAAAIGRHEGGEPFDELARELSDDASTRENGGDLGLVELSEIAKELGDVTSALEPGAISAATRTDRGLHVVLLEERIAAGVQSFEEVRDELARKGVLQQAALMRADRQSDELATAIRAGKSLEEAARELDIPVERTGLIRRRPDGFVPGLGGSQDLLFEAFALKIEKPTSPQIFTVNSKLALIQLIERKEPEPAVLSQALSGERDRLAEGKRTSFLQTWIDERRAQLIESGELLIDNSVVRG